MVFSMGEEYIILEGKDYEKLIAEGMQRFKAKKEDLEVEILESKKSLFSSYFKLKISMHNKGTLDAIEKSIDDILSQNLKVEQKNIDFDFREDGVYIKIDNDATMVDIVTKIDLIKIQSVDLSKLKQAMEVGNLENWIKIAEPQEEKKIDACCNVRITNDDMQAFISIDPPIGGEDITEKAIYEALKINGVVFNIKDDAVKAAAAQRAYKKEILVAEGVHPQNGKDAEIQYHFDTSTEKTIRIDEDGKVDFRELSLIKNVKRGDRLVTLIPHTEGTPGKTVRGIEVPGKDGKKLALPRGKNVDVTEDGLGLVSAVDGEVRLLDGKVNVFSVYEVKHDVDNSTGNIRFNGKVVVMGNVLTGFIIEAEGDVEVYGVVEGALIRSKGNIILHRGIQGMNRGELYCDGNLIAKFIENSKLEIKGNIQSDAIMHSQVICGKKLEASGRKGLLVGGSFKVGEEIKAKVLGSPMATITEVEVGVNPDMRKKYEEVKQELKQVSENLDKAAKAVELLTKINKNSELPADKKVLLSKSIQLKLQLSKRREELAAEQAELDAYFEELSRGRVRVYDTVYPGSRIIIGSSMLYVKDPVKFVSFYRQNAEIKMGSYDSI